MKWFLDEFADVGLRLQCERPDVPDPAFPVVARSHAKQLLLLAEQRDARDPLPVRFDGPTITKNVFIFRFSVGENFEDDQIVLGSVAEDVVSYVATPTEIPVRR